MTTKAPETSEETRIAVRSRALGDIEVELADAINFCEPIPGFPTCSRYALIPHTLPDGQVNDEILWLQAMDTPFHAFIVTDPWSAVMDYAPEISDADAADLGLTRFEDAKVLAILTVPEEGGMTINLRAPVVINHVTRTAKQVVLLSDQYHSAHALG